MWKELKSLFSKETLLDAAYQDSLAVLRECESMFNDAVMSLRQENPLDADIYNRDRQINKFEREVRRRIITHMSISTNPDTNMALVLTSLVMDIERIGDYTKNIVELAINHPGKFEGGELRDEIEAIEAVVANMFQDLIVALDKEDIDRARKIISDHQDMADRVEKSLEDLVAGKVLKDDSGKAVTAALFLRYLKRVSAHLKNVATGIVNPYYRIGFREKNASKDSDSES